MNNDKMIENKVEETFKRVDYKDNADAIDVILIAKKLGFIVANAGLSEDMDGFIIVEEGKDDILGIHTDKLIGVNASKGLEWKRFTIAHEIGHFILHYDRDADNGIYAHREHIKGKNEAENEADFFAANLLMPREKFMNKYRELKDKGLSYDEMIVLLANKFVVTQPTTIRRFKELGLIEKIMVKRKIIKIPFFRF